MLAHFAHHLLTALPTPLLPFIRNEFDLDYTQLALVVSAFSLSYGISQLPAGWLADRIGPRILITVGTCGVAIAGALVGLSGTYILMMVFLVLMGVAGGGYHPSSAPLVSAAVEPKKRGRALGIHAVGGGTSYFLAPIIAAAIAGAWGWRVSFIGLAVPTAIFGIIFYKYLGRWSAPMSDQSEISSHHGDKAKTQGNLRLLVAFMVLTVFTAGITRSITVFIPVYLVDQFGASEQTAAFFLSIQYSAGLWVSPIGGYMSDRLGRVPLMLTTSLVVGAVVYLLNLAPYAWGIITLLLIMGICIYIRIPVSEAYIMGRVPERHRSTIYGIYYFSMTEAGAVFAPIIGALIDHFDFYTTFTIASISVIAVMLGCAVFLLGSRN
ncbi:nitrate/nitrite transporter [Chloroflexota bacterium]